MNADVQRLSLQVSGVVQGVGFRPFVYGIAAKHSLAGFVSNTSEGVLIEVEGPTQSLAAFRDDLVRGAPPLARVQSVADCWVAPTGETGFQIIASTRSGGRALVPPDIALCADCRRELHDPGNRRYRHPFISCTNCGPRFTVIEAMPYDRARTSMRVWPLCSNCRAEYSDPTNRRFHAQTIACHDCGPQLSWLDRREISGMSNEPGPMERAQLALAAGAIVAIKGIGGYHIACNAADAQAVSRLRRLKGRRDKPFAVMVASLELANQLVHVDDVVSRALSDARGMIVIVPRRQDPSLGLAPDVAPGAPELGIMLPYSPLHELLLHPAQGSAPQALVMTSANLSDEPIITSDTDARIQLDGLVDSWLSHDRPIVIPCDDSVVRLCTGELLPVRRSRGFAPLPFALPINVPPTLALGGDIKTTVCLADGNQAWLSAHVGDMERASSDMALRRVVQHLAGVLQIDAQSLVVDMHPGYRTAQWAEREARGRPVIRVQHHQAHLASLLGESRWTGTEPVLGFIFDGAGYGLDGSIWGGEVLSGTLGDFDRVASLQPVWQPGGDAAVRRPYRMALAHLSAADVTWSEALPPVRACPSSERAVLKRQVTEGLLSTRTSSMGRLFDAVSSLTGTCQVAEYEAEAAMRFEHLARQAQFDQVEGYKFRLVESSGLLLAYPTEVIRQVASDVTQGVCVALIAARFHVAVADLITEIAVLQRSRSGVRTIGLSGGVFLNTVLTELAETRLVAAGFSVLRHRHVPPSDAGLALGQVLVVAAAQSVNQ